ncbi:MAG: nickel pincer cofactor biosynthesis protein LarC [Thermoleophilia bacterium]
MRPLSHHGGVQGLLRQERALDRSAPSRILYLDLWAGAAGDMLVASLLDLDPSGRLEAVLRETVARLDLEEVRLEVTTRVDRGFVCRRLDVTSGGSPPARTLSVAETILAAAGLSPWVAEHSRAALRRLAGVEAALHGVAPEQVHFHELGAADTLVDVVGCLALVDALGVGSVVCSPVPVGSGRVSTEHGSLGVPAPATLALLAGVPLRGGPEESEVTTPTGALLVTELAHEFGPLPAMTVEAVGYGGGSRRLEHGPNILRAVLGSQAAADLEPCGAAGVAGTPSDDLVVVLEVTLDDASPEVLAYLHALLLEGGALDAWWTPAYMKKGRLGAALTVLCRAEREAGLVDLVFRESTTFGVRRSEQRRHVLDREWVNADVRGELVRVKVGRRAGRVMTVAPEYEDAARVAGRLGIPLKEIMAEAGQAARGLPGC